VYGIKFVTTLLDLLSLLLRQLSLSYVTSHYNVTHTPLWLYGSVMFLQTLQKWKHFLCKNLW